MNNLENPAKAHGGDIKEGTEKAFNELKESFTKATKHFK